MSPVLFALTLACAPTTGGGDTGAAPVDSHDTAAAACPLEDAWIDPLGPTEPVVGDSWTVWLRCDDLTLTGPTVLQFDPPDFATVDGNVATFLVAGTATMHMQVGSYEDERSVTVSESPVVR